MGKRRAPPVRFSPWVRWEDLAETKPPRLPGIYILAHWKRRPRGRANPKGARIFYVGETRGQTLRDRLKQFYLSATHTKRRHSGGESYYEKFGDSRFNELCVAWYGVKPMGPGPLRSRYISFVEQRIIWRLGAPNLLNKAKEEEAALP